LTALAKRNKYPANPLKLKYENGYLLSEQVKWMVGQRGQLAQALELVRRHAVQDRFRELQAREERRKDTGPEEKSVGEREENEDENDSFTGDWKWSMRVADDEVFNTFISECASVGQYGWAEAGYKMVRWTCESAVSSGFLTVNSFGR
jgi:hypothetical protein